MRTVKNLLRLNNLKPKIEDTVIIFMNTRFPTDNAVPTKGQLQNENVMHRVPITDMTYVMVKEAIKSFSPYEATRPGIFPALLQNEVNLVSTHLAGVFIACLNHAYEYTGIKGGIHAQA